MFLRALATALSLALAPAAVAQSEAKHVLVIYGNRAELPWVKIFDDSLRATVASAIRQPVEFYTEYFDVARFPEAAQQEAFIELLRTRYRNRAIDAVVSAGAVTVDLLLERRKELFPGAPFVYSFLPPDRAAGPPLSSDVTGVMADFSPLPTIELALRLHPGTKRRCSSRARRSGISPGISGCAATRLRCTTGSTSNFSRACRSGR